MENEELINAKIINFPDLSEEEIKEGEAIKALREMGGVGRQIKIFSEEMGETLKAIYLIKESFYLYLNSYLKFKDRQTFENMTKLQEEKKLQEIVKNGHYDEEINKSVLGFYEEFAQVEFQIKAILPYLDESKLQPAREKALNKNNAFPIRGIDIELFELFRGEMGEMYQSISKVERATNFYFTEEERIDFGKMTKRDEEKRLQQALKNGHENENNNKAILGFYENFAKVEARVKSILPYLDEKKLNEAREYNLKRVGMHTSKYQESKKISKKSRLEQDMSDYYLL